MRPIALALALCCLAPLARAERPRGADDGPTLSDDSRWMSFIRLVGSRWRIRTQVPPPEDAQARRLLDQCLDDAWYLALPVLVEDAKSPCNVLVDSLKATEKADRAHRGSRDEYRRAFSTGALAPSREQYDACTAEAVDRADPDFLTVCALALKPRASLLASLTDQDRFGGWMGGCKKAMLGDPKAGETARQVQHTPAEDRQARHCLRTLPTLYEVQWLKKLSDFWTPEELRQLNLRSQQLGRN